MYSALDLSVDRNDLELVYKLVKQAPVAMTLLRGPSFLIEIANDKALEVWAKEHKNVINLPVFEVFPELVQQGFNKILNKVYTTGEAFVANEMPVMLVRNGRPETLYFNFTYEPLKTTENEVEGIVAIGVDVSAQVIARKTIEQSEKRAFDLLAQAAAAITVYEGEELRVIVSNKASLEVWGKKEEEVIGKPLLEILPELKDAPACHALQQVLHTGKPFEGKEIPIEFIREGKPHKRYFDVVYTVWKDGHGNNKGVITVGTEVTHSVLARKKVEESEEQLRIALEGGDLGYFDLYHRTGQLIWSERTKELFGLPPGEEASVENFRRVLHPDDRDKAMAVAEKAMQPGSDGVYENQYRVVGLSDGKLRWLRSRGKVNFDEQGNPIRFTGVVYDITKEKIAEENIRQSEERFRETFENAAVGIAHVGLDGSWLRVNDRLCEIVGYTKQELSTRTFQDITHPEDLEADLHLMYRLHDGKINTYSMEKRYFHKNSSIVWANLTVSLARDKQGRPQNYISIVEDITDQKNAEEALRRSEEQFRTLANGIQNLAWMADSDGWTFWYNDRWFEYTGTTLEKMQGWGWQKVQHPDHIERVLDFMQQAWKQGEPFELTFPLRRKDGEYRWFLTRAYPIKNTAGKVERWVGTNTDIDEQKTLEEKLEKMVAERTKELERSNADLLQFAHVASHDLKEPVRKIKTFGSLLQAECGNLLSPKGVLYLEKMEKATDRIYKMIDGVLLYSSLNAVEEAKENVDLEEIVRQIVMDLEVPISEKNAEMNFDKLPAIKGSAILIYQLFYNLINNSLKFSKGDEKPVINIFHSMLNNQVQIVVEDNGIGFNQMHAYKIFETFTRLNSREKYEGTGIGLALCQKIVERHHGTITAIGNEGVGARFVVTLPLD